MLFEHVLLCNCTMSRLQHYLLSLPVMTGCVDNKVLHFLPSLLLSLRHADISLSNYVNMLLLLVLVAMENQIMKHLLWSGTNQPMERINIMSPLRFFLHMPKLGRNSAMFELLEKLHQTRWSLHLRVVIFLQPPTSHCQNF
jgi:hypothetical protein